MATNQKKKKSLDPIVFPHDGPLFVAIYDNGNDNVNDNVNINASSSDNCQEDSVGLIEAKGLLQNLSSTSNDMDANVDDSNTNITTNIGATKGEQMKSYSIKLISQLLNATTLKDQIGLLRFYRNDVLKIEKTMTDKDSTSDSTSDSTISIISGMYRFIFEICLSSKTPLPLKKAGYSCLSAIMSYSTRMSISSNDVLFDNIHSSILNSLFSSGTNGSDGSSKVWANPVQVLFELLTYSPTQSKVLQSYNHTVSAFKLILSEGAALYPILISVSTLALTSTSTSDKINDDHNAKNENMFGVAGSNLLEAVEKSFEICTTLKLMLTTLLTKQQQQQPFTNDKEGKNQSENQSKNKQLFDLCVSIIEKILKPLLHCRAASTDALTVCGLCYGQILFFKWRIEINGKMNGNGNGDKNDDEKFIAKNVYTFLISLLGPNKEKDSLPNLMIIKGLASTLTDSILIQTQENDHDQDTSSNSNSNRTLLIHPIASYMIQMSQCSANDAIRLWALKGLGTVVGRCKAIVASNPDSNSNNTTQLHDLFVTQARELANDVLQLSLVTFDSPPCKQIGSAIPGLFKILVDLMEILDQKAHHHNDDEEDNENTKMESMEILVGRILAQPPSRKGKYIALDSLLYKIGASKLMQLAEVQESESLVSSFVQEIGDRGNSAGSVAELLGKIISLLREEMHREAGIDLHRAEETKKERRRREKKILEQGVEKSDVSNEDVVRLLPQWMNVWVPSFASAMLSLRRKHISSYCLPLIIAMVGGTSRKMDACHSFAALLDELDNREDATDCLLWAKLEVIRHASLHKLLKSNLCSNILRNSVSKVVTLDVLKMALIHESSKIRVVAFQTIGSILPTLSEELSKDPIKCILLEAELWKESLVYAFNCSEREHMLVLNSTLQGFLHKIVEVETTHVHDKTSSILSNFVNDILLDNLFLKQGYPGTIPEKESFALKMLDSIIIFSSRTNVNKKVTPKTKSFEQDWNSNIIAALVSDNVFANLLSLLYSMWDATRESAYSCICKLIELARHDKLPLPHFFTSEDSYSLLRARATHLASSPRQREADTGARMLAILCAVLPTEEEREKNLKNLSQYLVKRLDLMAKSLGVAFNPRIEDANLDDSEQMAKNSNELPLAHGLIQALRLIIDDNRVINITDSQIIFVDLTSICCHAIEVSLAVVADINDDTSDKKLEQEKGGATKQSWKLARAKKLESTPLNVNTGALGANATFASCMPTGEELTKRLAMQRILVGSWLLTKEACAALSSVITLIPGQIDYNIISTAGDLLISTLTSLKHQGAAFAAHKSLQKVCARCYKEGDGNGIRLLPSSWSQRLIFEISSPEIVRDSILRCSTGYDLGTLSILRTEECSGPRFLFPTILSSIIKLSLPSSSIMKKYGRRWKFSSVGEMLQYACNLIETESDFVEDKDYEVSTDTPTTSLRNLELGYEEACDMCSSDELFTMLTKQIICHCKNVEINVTEMTNEFNYTVGDKDLADVQNLSTERKIFEEEDLNVFEESLLIIHLSIQKLTNISKTYKHQDSEDRELFQDLILICKRVLKRINCIKGQIGQTADIAHNLSWTIKVFPGIHGLLLGSIFSIYHFGTEGNDIVEEANKILIEGNLIHPCTSEALNVLSHARYNCNTTFDSLLKCCFLAPI